MKLHFIALAALGGLALGASAQAQNMKPGLWEIQHKTTTAGGQMDPQTAQMQQQMANMPPDQRKMVEEMMASRGVKMDAGGPGGMSVRICMTPEMAQRNEVPAQQRGDCKTTQSARSGNTMKMTFTCTNPPSRGEGEVTFSSSEAYSMRMNVHTQVQGRPEKTAMEGTGKWLGADCGDLKPMRPPAK